MQEPVYYPVPDSVPSGALDPGRLMVAGNGRVFARIPDSPKRERGLDIEVDPNPGLRNRRVNVRSDNGEPLGEVSTSYPVVNNRQAFAFLSNLIGSELHFETAGSLWGGRRIWVMAKVPDWIEIGGDTVETYLCVDTRHDGQGCVRGIVAPIRVVCQNTLHAAVQSAQQSFKVKHAGDPSRALADARTAMEITVNYAEQFKAMGDRLASEQAGAAKVQEVLRELYPTDESMPKQTKKNRIASRETITEILRQEGPTVGNAPGSKWALLNVLCEYIDFYGGRRERDVSHQAQRERTFRSAVDDSTGMKTRAFELVAN